MKRLALLFLILGISCATTSTVDARPRNHMSRALDSTIAITTDDGRVYCSGFISEGFVITAAHCVEGDLFVNVRTRSGERHLMRVVRYNETQDVAALKSVDGWKLGKGIPLARQAPGYGDGLLVLGHSQGLLDYSLTSGIVSHPRRLNGLFADMVWMQHDAGSIGGNSGGPVMNSRGQLVGLTSFGILGRTFCTFGCSDILTRTHISGAVHFESIDALLNSL